MHNVEESPDWRRIMDHWGAVSTSEMLAPEVTLQWLYNNGPACQTLERRPDLDSPAVGTVLRQLDELDTIFSISLVVNF